MNLTRRTKNAPPSNLLGTQVRVRGLDAKQRTVEVIASSLPGHQAGAPLKPPTLPRVPSQGGRTKYGLILDESCVLELHVQLQS